MELKRCVQAKHATRPGTVVIVRLYVGTMTPIRISSFFSIDVVFTACELMLLISSDKESLICSKVCLTASSGDLAAELRSKTQELEDQKGAQAEPGAQVVALTRERGRCRAYAEVNNMC